MKKIDKLIFKAFIGPFILTLGIVVFILLIQHLLRYMDEIIGKDLGLEVYAELFLNFAYVTTPMAMPLAILLSSIMTFGNLGQHFELTAIKGAGISLVRALLPIFIFSIFLSIAAYYSNYYLVPRAALNAYSLLWDVKQKKPSMELKAGVFYNGIPNYSIKINDKDEETELLKGLMIYDHSKNNGNTNLTVADSGRMISINEGRYLKLEMFNGARYADGESNKSVLKRRRNEPADFIKTEFEKTYYIFDLSSMIDGLDQRTDKELFARNRIMRNREQLVGDIDSIQMDISQTQYSIYQYSKSFFLHHGVKQELVPQDLKEQVEYYDSIRDLKRKRADSIQIARSTKIEDSLAERYARKESKDLSESREDSLEGKNDSVKINTSKKNDNTGKRGGIVSDPISVGKNINPLTKEQLDSIRRVRSEDLREKSIKNKRDRLRNEDRFSQINLKDSVSSKSIDSLEELNTIDSLSEIESAEMIEESISDLDDQTTRNLKRFKERVSVSSTKKQVYRRALTRARQNKGKIESKSESIKDKEGELRAFIVEYHKKFAMSFACVIMFLIGAPLGSIIKKGGLGFPTIVSVIFFIIYYVLSIFGEKWGKEELINPALGAWMANIILFPLGIYFLQQARIDARLFDADYYAVTIKRLKKKFIKNK
ncbi:LptF/LptG family permease [Marinigracilibium pacificum]|uniref:LptF/LptG family permease n=1 Tax=Marinigracilibium pacificum TaxID=2729599 RepID=A0A848J1L4_9BACT|nr:LptF/LptG family permease [Marinigracilibium pacificum]NMM50447.1 LptF/LptG family permease [Marinigracilibium pacificum]